MRPCCPHHSPQCSGDWSRYSSDLGPSCEGGASRAAIAPQIFSVDVLGPAGREGQQGAAGSRAQTHINIKN